MFESLVEFAQSKNLVDVEGYQLRPIRWLVHIRSDGSLVNVEDTQTAGDRPGAKPRPKQSLAPTTPKRSINVKASAFVDNSKYVFGYETSAKEETVLRAQACKWSFRDIIRFACEQTRDETAAAALRFLERFDAGEFLDRVPPADHATNDLFGFILEPQRSALHDPQNRTLHTFIVTRESDRVSNEVACSVCERRGTVARTHDNIKGVAGAMPKGADMVSFNQSAFCSYGFEQGANAPMCLSCMASYTTALNAMLDRHKLKQSVRIGNAASIVYWTRGGDANGVADSLFGELLEGSPEAVGRLFQSAKTGLKMTVYSGRVYAVTLTGDRARIAARNWIEETISSALENLRRHFADLDMEGADRPPSIWALLEALSAAGKGEATATTLSGPLTYAALCGRPYPLGALEAAVRRNRADNKMLERHTGALRAGIIKAVLLRLPSQPYGELKPMLDPETKEPAYRCGRLLAVLDRLQELATGAAAGVVERYFGSASSAPASVFGTLLRNAQNHLSKLDQTSKSNGIYFNRLIGEILASMAEFPHTLSVQEQGLFALGFYHQRQTFFTKRQSATSEDNVT
ncbi:MAG: type I-C CRISPR-associated protein Cas8c/Csd1 [Candidatus Eremiobacteraeota bacterium]|nr:type I-C CRISPR-associated protein Cas8c/Csd1 [Candidatus Eremiobacteraeota bacterium]MBC5822195.1 type I-C CRISPR-associated protein Cas8c/Csd1 [Candidatus Eremiobacteraeota bacterium]